MQSRRLGAALAVAALAAAVALFVVLRDEEEDSGSTPVRTTTVGEGSEGGDNPEKAKARPAVPTVEVRNSEPVGGPAEISVSKGERVELRVEAGGGGYVHVHGYDADRELNAKGVAKLSFPASTDGVYEVEYHAAGGSHVAVAEITVNP